MPTKVFCNNGIKQHTVLSAKVSRNFFWNFHFILLLSLATPVGANQSNESLLLECRAKAARDAGTDTGAKAMLADCARRFPRAQTPTPPAPSEEDCQRQGLVRIEMFSGPTCSIDHRNRPCTAEELGKWKDAEVPKTACAKRGDSWNEKLRLCFRKGEFFGPPVCKK